MNTLIILLSLVALAAPIMPNKRWRGRNLSTRNTLSAHLFQRRKMLEENNCKRLVGDTLALLEFFSNSDIVPVKEIERLSKRLFGFDVFQDTRAVERLICTATPATSIADLKERLDNNCDFSYRLFTFLYDHWVTVILIQGIRSSSPEEQHDVELLHSLGILNLNPQRDDLKLGVNPGEVDLTRLSTLSLQNKCQTLQNIIHRKFSALNDESVKTMLNRTGIDISDNEQLDTLLCDIMEAAEVNLRKVYEVFEDHGIVNEVYRIMYPLAVDQVQKVINFLEVAIKAANDNDSDSDEASRHKLILMSLSLNMLRQLEATGLLDLK